MKSENEISGFEIVFKLLGVIWTPALEAIRIQEELNVHSLEETSIAAERTGCEVCYVDLPVKVSGLATSIANKPWIVVNRAKSAEHQEYTVLHELGHHVLRLDPSRTADQFIPARGSLAEFQAHLFAIAWIIRSEDPKKRQDLLQKNPESSLFVLSAATMTAVILVFALLAYLFPRSRPRHSTPVEEL